MSDHLRLVEPPEVDDDEDDGDGDDDYLIVEASFSGTDDILRGVRLIRGEATPEEIAELMITAIRSVAAATGLGVEVALDLALTRWGAL